MLRNIVFSAVLLCAMTASAARSKATKAEPVPAPAPAPAAAPAPAKPADTQAPVLEHVPLASAPSGTELALEAKITDPSGVFGAMAYFRLVGEEKYTPYAMESKDETHFKAIVPGARVTADFEYYLEAYDSSGNGPTLSGSQEKPIRVKVEAPPVAATITAPPVEPAAQGLNVPALAVAGVGAVGLIVGAVLYTGASSKVSQIDGKYAAKGAPRVPADAEATRSAVSQSRIGSVTMIGGALATAGGAAWLLVPMLMPPSGDVTLVGGGGGVALEGSF